MGTQDYLSRFPVGVLNSSYEFSRGHIYLKLFLKFVIQLKKIFLYSIYPKHINVLYHLILCLWSDCTHTIHILPSLLGKKMRLLNSNTYKEETNNVFIWSTPMSRHKRVLGLWKTGNWSIHFKIFRDTLIDIIGQNKRCLNSKYNPLVIIYCPHVN